jgi:hypothetical protein
MPVYKQTDIVTESKVHGGKRDGAGRKLKYNEPTGTIRLPISIIEKLKSGNFEIITNSNNADYLKLKLENEKLTNENIALKNSLKEYIECVHFLKTKNDKLELSYQDDIDFLTPIESYIYTTGKEYPLNYLIVKNMAGFWFRKCTSITDKFSFDSHLTTVENDDTGFFMMVFDKRIDLKVTTIKKLPSYCLKKYNADLNLNEKIKGDYHA